MIYVGEIKIYDHIYSVSLMIRCMLLAWNINRYFRRNLTVSAVRLNKQD